MRLELNPSNRQLDTLTIKLLTLHFRHYLLHIIIDNTIADSAADKDNNIKENKIQERLSKIKAEYNKLNTTPKVNNSIQINIDTYDLLYLHTPKAPVNINR